MITTPDTIAEIQRALRGFARERDWEKYHTPKNLAALIASEAGELLALYRWHEQPAGGDMGAVADEVADVFLGVLRFADVAGINLRDAATSKLQKNAAKYPANRTSPEASQPSRGTE